MENTTHANQEVIEYIHANPVAIIGTVNNSGTPHGAAVYVVALKDDGIYFVTKNETQKYKNLQQNPHVSLTIVNTAENSSLQATGKAFVEEDPTRIGDVMQALTEVYAQSADWLPPIAKIHAGPYEVVRVELNDARLAHFKGQRAGSEHIFKEV